MLLLDTRAIGNKLLLIRKRSGLTQADVAELAGISDRTYADIERGGVNMRVETVLRICDALHITPDEILTADDTEITSRQEEILARLDACSPKDKETALRLLSVFLQSLAE
jgi:transcriptional regulator with XRE-family HTH domain